ncbi:MAG: nucleotide exchange factor GrpE [Candidatus Shapirobacteria bacterium]|nr:nucleotide exchange factor GrpE [Candidatus Shapirobacteria bacterium]MDD3002384.1 nucleotide exchange factor GrpE [Candidatus Shapirobacteria bacterium]MDD4383308.1 nucleotide exchange factor GrpE [Candidatus Shapirobacteria bacterium]
MSKDKKVKTNSPNNAELLEKITSLEERLARSLADYSNLEKRIDSQRQLFVTLATTSILSKMVEVLDNFYLAQNHLNDPGLKMAIDKFDSVLKTEGLEEINPLGLEFDPQSMECIETVEGKENFVIEVKKLGYKLNGHVIRPAQVSVGKNLPN